MAIDYREKEACIRRLEEWLRAGHVDLGGRLPGERLLCDLLDASRHLVRLSLNTLQERGIIQRRGKSGS